MNRMLICRAKLVKGCLDGQRTSKQFGVQRDGGDPPMSEDGTFNGTSMICAPCMQEATPFVARSAANPNTGHIGWQALNEGVARYRSAIRRVREATDLSTIVRECEDEMRRSSAFSANYHEAKAVKSLALKEQTKRKEAEAVRERVQARNESEEAAGGAEGEAAPEAAPEAATAETEATPAGSESSDTPSEAATEEGTPGGSETVSDQAAGTGAEESASESENSNETTASSAETETETEEQPA